MRRFLLPFALAAVVALCGASCLSPTLPLPPPDVGSVQLARAGVWTVGGTCQPGAFVTVFDDNSGLGVVYEDKEFNGTFTVELEANPGDSAWASQTLLNETSAHDGFTIAPCSENTNSCQ